MCITLPQFDCYLFNMRIYKLSLYFYNTAFCQCKPKFCIMHKPL